MAFPLLLLLLISINLAQIKSHDDYANCLIPKAPIEQKTWAKSPNEGNQLELIQKVPKTTLIRGILLPPKSNLNKLLMGGVEYDVEIEGKWRKYDTEDNNNMTEGTDFLIRARTNKYGGFAVEMPDELLDKYGTRMDIRFSVPGDILTVSSVESSLFQHEVKELEMFAYYLIEKQFDRQQVERNRLKEGQLLALNDECHQIESLKKEGDSGIWIRKMFDELNKLKKEQEKLKKNIDEKFEGIEKHLGEQKSGMDSLKNGQKRNFNVIIGMLTKLEENFVAIGKEPKKRGFFNIGGGS